MKRLLVLCTLLLGVSIGCLAQVVTGDILGTITDPSGAVVTQAQIVITNTSTHETHELTSSNAGEYIQTALPSGYYNIKVTAPGFKTVEVTDVKLDAGSRLREDIKVSLGATSQTVQVAGETPALVTDSATLSGVITEERVKDLPLNGRNFFQLADLAPGANEGPAAPLASGTRPDDRREWASVSVFAQSDTLNNIMVDGLDNNEKSIGSTGIRPGVEAIAEFQVQTNDYPAEVGKTPGAVVNVITKSGTNDFHGALYEFVRNDKFDAVNFFTKPGANTEYRQNQFGGALGGPIRRDKTFFFLDYDAYRIVQAVAYVSTVPTAFEEQHPGNLSDIGGPVLPASLLNPIALKYFALYPAPNLPGTINNYASSPNRTQNSDSFDVRLDQNFSDRDRFTARYSFNNVNTVTPDSFPAVGGIQPGGSSASYPGTSPDRSQQALLAYSHMWGANKVLELRAGYTRINNASYPLNYGKDLGNQFGIVNSNINPTTACLPQVSITNYTGMGNCGALPLIDLDNIFQYEGSLSQTIGKHTLKYGAELLRRRVYNFQNGSGPGSFSFTTLPGIPGVPSAAVPLVNFFQGTAYSVSRSVLLSAYYFERWEPSAYVQDDWRVTPWLTLNLGLRYDVFTPYTDASGNQQFSCFDPGTASLLTAKQNGVSATCNVKTDFANLAPRFGFAASLRKDTVLRGGYALVYFNDQTGPLYPFLNPPLYNTYSPNVQTVGLSTPLPLPSNAAVASSRYGIQQNYKNSRVNQVNLNLQHSFNGTVVTLGYVGEFARALRIVPNINVAPPQPAPLNSYVTKRPFYPLLPNVTGIYMVSSFGATNYDAMLLTVEHRLSHGLTFIGSYTWGHSTGDYQSYSTGGSYYSAIPSQYGKLEWGNTDLDIRQRFSLMLNYALPFGSSLTGWKGGALKGWHFNAIAVYQTGAPFSVVNSTPQSNTGVSSDRPNVIGNPYLANPTIHEWFNPAAFAPQAIGTIGSEGRNILTGPPFRHLDCSIFKDFKVRERYTLQARFESYNITNTPNFALPSATLGSTTVGTITSTRSGSTPRELQFALRFSF
ncbi:MAG TPA: TonB-dependent receptor [Bryobacteraceae bacterium]|nr:TonB-dependent receptor [Bryobacteraceae bacterium]